MKTQIDIITGFLEGGKTSFIQNMLENAEEQDGKTIIIQCEYGIEELSPEYLNEQKALLLTIEKVEDLTAEFFQLIENTYVVNRIIVEYNGTWTLDKLLKIKLPPKYFIGEVLCIANAKTFTSYVSNMGNIIPEQISNCDALVLTRYEKLDKESLNAITQIVKSFNKKAKIILIEEQNKINKVFSNVYEKQSNKQYQAFIIIVSFWMLYMLLDISQSAVFEGAFSIISTVNTVFLSIIIQAVPFILIGAFVSSILQVFVSDEKIISLFCKNKWLGFPIAAVLGVFFPVCDCAMAPIIARLVKKGVPIPQAVTFLLASPAVNPVVIISTLYAFPDRPIIAVYRIIIGLAVALLAGVVLNLLAIKNETALRNTFVQTSCSNGYLGSIPSAGFRGKIEALFRHAGLEFLNVMKFVVVGAFVSAIIQSTIPKSFIEAHSVFPFAIMIFAAFFMSVCSTSNAFIARSFSSIFPISSVLIFMIMGPMLDLKNLLMISSSFKKKFILKLVVILIIIAFVVFTIVGKVITI